MPFSVFAGVIMIVYQWSLSRIEFGGYPTLTHYIFLKDRDGLFSANREGIFSFLGISLVCGDRSDVRLFIDILGGSGYWRNYITHQVSSNVVHQGIYKDGEPKNISEKAVFTSAK